MSRPIISVKMLDAMEVAYYRAMEKWQVNNVERGMEWISMRVPDWGDEKHVVEHVAVSRFFSQDEAHKAVIRRVLEEVGETMLEEKMRQDKGEKS